MSHSVDLTLEQEDRLNRLEALEEGYQIDEEVATQRALKDLHGYSFADLERFIQAVDEEFEQVADLLGDLISQAPPNFPSVAGKDSDRLVDEEKRKELRRSEDYFEYRKKELKCERRLVILRSRGRAARELRRRHLYGQDVSELGNPDTDFGSGPGIPDRTYDRRIWALRYTEPGSSVKEWIGNALATLEEYGYQTRKPESVQRTLRSQLKDRYDPGRLDLGTFKQLVYREAKRLSLPSGPEKAEKPEEEEEPEPEEEKADHN
jgi:hypothetical protein